jgi:hypothetical protein
VVLTPPRQRPVRPLPRRKDLTQKSLVARRVGIIPASRLTIVISSGGSRTGRGCADTYRYPPTHWRTVDAVNATVINTGTTNGSTATSGEGVSRESRNTRDAKDEGRDKRHDGSVGHDCFLSCPRAYLNRARARRRGKGFVRALISSERETQLDLASCKKTRAQ